MNIVRTIYFALTPKLRFVARRIYYFPYDAYMKLFKRQDDKIPPRGMIFIGSGDFRQQGERLKNLVVEHTGLKPDGKILDVGCGIGRLAIPLTRYLSAEGLYEGFDIVKMGIRWCNRNITPEYPNFHFRYVDLKNDLYNLSTENEAKSFQFPYPRNSFDSVVLTSVFTHMMPEDVQHYLEQISQVLKDGGRCMATFFIIDEEVRKAMNDKQTTFEFNHAYNGYYLMSANVKEANVAYDENYLYDMIRQSGMQVILKSRGGWSKGREPLDFQDLLVLTKK
ncbi:MAG: class I SAM-dependent methyltransferase [Bacteroidetes bacterium]|uniref:Class I SAM-dependent methyltransferase n=1 Tax=Candidatus Caccoplasma merdipullorum TaxID=2840718 RepID=A0A9D9E160_9BACT|nr:class I SAM-dependent methyltransferase [Candidatus Caccoplasma merdipullorum]